MRKVYIVILNYNSWRDTIECLESILKLEYPEYRVVIVDNASPNDSVDRLMAWASGEEIFELKSGGKPGDFAYPPAAKPIKLTTLTQTESSKKLDGFEGLVLIRSDRNLGYSAGNNLGMNFGLVQDDADFFWILNNDVVVEPNSLNHLVQRAEFYVKNNQKVGIVGAKIMHYHLPERIQAASGSKFFKTFLSFKIPRPTVGLGNMEIDNGQFNREVDVDFVNGACMLVSRVFVEDVGLLSEEYFLYLEEPDWVERGKKNNWAIGYSWEARVFHKEGASSGGGTHRRTRVSFLSDYYFHRNKVLLTKKYYPKHLFLIYVGLLITILRRFFRGQWNRSIKFAIIFFDPTRTFDGNKTQL